MLPRAVHYLVVLAFCWVGLASVRQRAQVLAGTLAGGFGHSPGIYAAGALWAVGDSKYGQAGANIGLAVYDGLGHLGHTTASPALAAAGLPASLYLARATAPGPPVQAARLLVA